MRSFFFLSAKTQASVYESPVFTYKPYKISDLCQIDEWREVLLDHQEAFQQVWEEARKREQKYKKRQEMMEWLKAPFLADPRYKLLQGHLQRIYSQLTADEKGLPEIDLSPDIFRNSSINFATRRITINLGEYLEAQTEDEIAASIAHELGHWHLRHEHKNGERAGVYSQKQELDADRYGIELLMKNVHFNPHAFFDMFAAEKRSQKSARLLFVSTHPCLPLRQSQASVMLSANRSEFSLKKSKTPLSAELQAAAEGIRSELEQTRYGKLLLILNFEQPNALKYADKQRSDIHKIIKEVVLPALMQKRFGQSAKDIPRTIEIADVLLELSQIDVFNRSWLFDRMEEERLAEDDHLMLKVYYALLLPQALHLKFYFPDVSYYKLRAQEFYGSITSIKDLVDHFFHMRVETKRREGSYLKHYVLRKKEKFFEKPQDFVQRFPGLDKLVFTNRFYGKERKLAAADKMFAHLDADIQRSIKNILLRTRPTDCKELSREELEQKAVSEFLFRKSEIGVFDGKPLWPLGVELPIQILTRKPLENGTSLHAELFFNMNNIDWGKGWPDRPLHAGEAERLRPICRRFYDHLDHVRVHAANARNRKCDDFTFARRFLRKFLLACGEVLEQKCPFKSLVESIADLKANYDEKQLFLEMFLYEPGFYGSTRLEERRKHTEFVAQMRTQLGVELGKRGEEGLIAKHYRYTLARERKFVNKLYNGPLEALREYIGLIEGLALTPKEEDILQILNLPYGTVVKNKNSLWERERRNNLETVRKDDDSVDLIDQMLNADPVKRLDSKLKPYLEKHGLRENPDYHCYHPHMSAGQNQTFFVTLFDFIEKHQLFLIPEQKHLLFHSSAICGTSLDFERRMLAFYSQEGAKKEWVRVILPRFQSLKLRYELFTRFYPPFAGSSGEKETIQRILLIDQHFPKVSHYRSLLLEEVSRIARSDRELALAIEDYKNPYTVEDEAKGLTVMGFSGVFGLLHAPHQKLDMLRYILTLDTQSSFDSEDYALKPAPSTVNETLKGAFFYLGEDFIASFLSDLSDKSKAVLLLPLVTDLLSDPSAVTALETMLFAKIPPGREKFGRMFYRHYVRVLKEVASAEVPIFISYLLALSYSGNEEGEMNEGKLLRRFFEAMGSLGVSLAQKLSVRNALPAPILRELRKLTDQATPPTRAQMYERLDQLGLGDEHIGRLLGSASTSVVVELLRQKSVALKYLYPNYQTKIDNEHLILEKVLEGLIEEDSETFTFLRPIFKEIQRGLVIQGDLTYEQRFFDLHKERYGKGRKFTVVTHLQSTPEYVVMPLAEGVSINSLEEKQRVRFAKELFDMELSMLLSEEGMVVFNPDSHPGNFLVNPDSGQKFVFDLALTRIWQNQSTRDQVLIFMAVVQQLKTSDRLNAAQRQKLLAWALEFFQKNFVRGAESKGLDEQLERTLTEGVQDSGIQTETVSMSMFSLLQVADEEGFDDRIISFLTALNYLKGYGDMIAPDFFARELSKFLDAKSLLRSSYVYFLAVLFKAREFFAKHGKIKALAGKRVARRLRNQFLELFAVNPNFRKEFPLRAKGLKKLIRGYLEGEEELLVSDLGDRLLGEMEDGELDAEVMVYRGQLARLLSGMNLTGDVAADRGMLRGLLE